MFTDHFGGPGINTWAMSVCRDRDNNYE